MRGHTYPLAHQHPAFCSIWNGGSILCHGQCGVGEGESLGELLHSVSAWGLGLVTAGTIPVSHVLSLPGTSTGDFWGRLEEMLQQAEVRVPCLQTGAAQTLNYQKLLQGLKAKVVVVCPQTLLPFTINCPHSPSAPKPTSGSFQTLQGQVLLPHTQRSELVWGRHSPSLQAVSGDCLQMCPSSF